jgi:hypothetical protein
MTNGAALPPGWANHASQAQPVVPVDPTTGDAVSWASVGGGGGGGSSTDVAIHDAITTTQHLVVNPDGSINVNPSSSAASTALNDATTTTQHLAIDASGNASVKLGTALPAGTAVIGHVIVDSAGSVSITALPALPTGSNAIGTVGVTSLPALVAGTAVIGHVVVDSAESVSVTSLPALPAGSNAIGSVSVSNLPATQPVSAAALPLPTGAALSAKQAQPGTAGTASADVLSVQGIASMTPMKVDGSAVTQPVSGTVTVNALPTGANVIGHVVVDSAGSVSVTALPALPTGTNSIGTVGLNAGSALIGGAYLIDSAGTNKAGVDVSNNQLVKVNAALPAGSALMGGTYVVDSAGTNKATVDAAGNQWIRGGFAEQASLTAGSLNADLVASTDVIAYRYMSLQVTGTWTGTLTFQGSNDNTNFSSILLTTIAPNSVNYAQTTASNNIFVGFIPTRYLRIRMTSYTSGTANATLELWTIPPTSLSTYVAGSVQAAQSGTWTVQMPTSATGTLTSVAGATGNTQLLASNTSRKGAYFFNDSTAIMYLAFNATASTTSYTVQVPANSFFEMPTAPIYTGQVNVVWGSATGNCRTSEMS